MSNEISRADKAEQLFKEGFNCAQAVFIAFCDEMNLDRSTAIKLSSSFGGGMGRLREVCGAVSGMFLVAGALYGYEDPTDSNARASHYALIQDLAGKFKAENGSIICRELLGLTQKKDPPTPESRTPEYYKKRPCAELVKMAAQIMDDEIQKRKKG